MRMSIEDRGGFALPAALLALVVVGALVTGGLYAAMEEDRSSGNVEHGNHAFLTAERGLEDLLGTADRPYLEAVGLTGAVGEADTVGPVAINVNGVSAQYTLYVQRLTPNLFKVDSEGEILGGGRYIGSKRRITEFMRIHTTLVPTDRAMTTQSPMRMRGQSGVSGDDTYPAHWTDCTDKGVRTGIVAKDVETIDIKGAGGVTGSPDTLEDSTLDYNDFSEYGDLDIDELKEYANIRITGTYSQIAPVVSGGECDESVDTNWGDPDDASSPCHMYWPIIYVPGDLVLTGGGVGQGILIVDGDLQISGSFEFHGLIFVYGAFKASGTGNKINGSLNVYGMGTDTTDLGEPTGGAGVGNTQIQLSSCAIERAHLMNTRFSRPIPLAVRRFVDLSGLGLD